MYDGLTPLFDQVQHGDLTTYFKSEALGSLGTDGPGTPDNIPGRPDIQITRDVYSVPHVVRDSYDGGIFAAGWIAAKDRGLLLNQARYNGRVAAIDAPGLSAIGLITAVCRTSSRASRPRPRSRSRRSSSRRPARRARPSSPTSTPTSRGSTPTLAELTLDGAVHA